MKSLKQINSHVSLNQTIFALSVLLSLLPSLVWLSKAWLFSFYGTAGIWGSVSLMCLFLWSLTSPKCCYQCSNKTFLISLFTIASILPLFSLGINESVIRGLALSLDFYALSLLLGLRYRKRALMPEWLVLLFILSLPVDLPGSGVNTLVVTGSMLCILMAIAQPSLIKSLLSLGLLSTLGLMGSSLRFYFDVDDALGEILALTPGIILTFAWFFLIRKKPIKAQSLNRYGYYTIPSKIKQDGWWLDLPKIRRSRRVKTVASIALLLLISFNFISVKFITVA